MDWLTIVPALTAAVLLLLVPGVMLAVPLGLRGFAIPAVAPALSMSVIAVASTIAPMAHATWSVWPVLATTLAAGLVLLVLRILLRRFDRTEGREAPTAPDRRRDWTRVAVYILSVLIPAVLLGKILISVFVGPDNFSQTFDNVFHLNALQYIRETGSASSLSIGRMADSPYYPSGWHAFASLVGQISSASIPMEANAANLAIGALVWPLSMVYLVWRLFGRSPLALIGAGALSASFAAFPLLMVDFGVLYPNFLGLALLPACVGQLFHALGLGHRRPANAWLAWILLGAMSMGMTIAHPSALMALIAVSILPAFQVYARRVAPSMRRGEWLAVPVVVPSVALVAVLAAAAVVWKVVRPDPAAAFWPPTQTFAQAAGEALTVSPVRLDPSWLIAGLVLIGIYRSIRQPGRRAVLGFFVVVAALYVVVSGFAPGSLRNFLVGVWYNDSYRLAAMLPMAAIPLAVEGLLQIAAWLRYASGALSRSFRPGWASDRRLARARAVSGFSGVVVVVLALVGLSHGGQVHAEELAAKSMYEVRPNSPLVTSDELALLDRLDSHVPPGSVIAGSPYTGTALAYALADRKTLQLHILSAITPEIQAVDTGLRDAPANGAACAAIKDLHVQYVLDFGTQEIHYENHPYHGVEDLQGSPAVQLIDQQGSARLYKVVACQG